MHMEYTPIIGLEIHVELATASKMFCGCKNDPFYAEQPNMHTCPVCLGLPGGLPVPNHKAIIYTIKLGLALGCEITELSKFDRKNYFYPDLAKGYQISQYDMPFCTNGLVRFAVVGKDGKKEQKTVRINRVHLEEDTGKLIHGSVDGKKVSLVDFNRSGVPLVEIVTEPDIRSGEEAKAFLKKLHQIIRYLEISGADMEKGSMRLEPNISVTQLPITNSGLRIEPEELPPYKVEVKNINSFNFVKKAIDFEVKRHSALLDTGETPKQETRGYVESTATTVSQRSKEDAMDYRYFPEPDIPPIDLTRHMIDAWKQELPELPDEKINRFLSSYSLKEEEVVSLTETKDKADYFEGCIALLEGNERYSGLTAGVIAKAIINRKQDGSTISPHDLLEECVKKRNDASVDQTVMTQAVTDVLREQPSAIADYKNGKEQALMFLVGQVKRKLQGKGDAKHIENLLKEVIK